MLYDLNPMWNLKEPNLQKERTEWWLPWNGGRGDVGQWAHTSRYKWNKFQGSNAQYDDYG